MLIIILSRTSNIPLGTAISPPGPNDTLAEPTTISVGAVVHDVIVLNIPSTLASVTDKVEVRIEERQVSTDSVTQTINFTTSFMAIGNSRGQQQTIMIPSGKIAAFEKGSAYFVKVSAWIMHVVRAKAHAYTTMPYNRLNLFL